VIAATQSLLAERGVGVGVEAVATRAGVGKATIYRRWPTSAGLFADAVLATDPLPATPCTAADPRTLLVSLLERLGQALTPAEQTVAAALSQALWEPELHRATEHVLLAPLRERVREACLLAGTDDESALSTSVALVEGLWIRRYLLTAPLLTDAEVRAVVDDVLLALVPHPATPRA
jgi:AcrR family transcriptional regulator